MSAAPAYEGIFVPRLFGAYVVVDWSAAEGRKTGEQSLWIGVMKRDVRFRLAYEAHNPPTRAEGERKSGREHGHQGEEVRQGRGAELEGRGYTVKRSGG